MQPYAYEETKFVGDPRIGEPARGPNTAGAAIDHSHRPIPLEVLVPVRKDSEDG